MRRFKFLKKLDTAVILALLQALMLSGVIALLFYQSIWALFFFLPLFPFLLRRARSERSKKKKRELSFQFKECIQSAAGALRAGYSPENAFAESEKDMVRLLGQDAAISIELGEINRQVRLNLPLEGQLLSLALRSGVEEILSFAQVFAHAKRSGGDFLKILRETAERISEKIEISREIQSLIAAKQMEQRIMNVIPLGLLLLISIGSPGFLDILYTSLLGRAVMTGCLLIYAFAWLLSQKIVEIEV